MTKVMVFESRQLPEDGNLVPLLRKSAKEGVDERGDIGDFTPFDWVARLWAAHPEWRDHIDDAYAALLTAEDPLPRFVLEQLLRPQGRTFLGRLYQTIEGRCAELAARVDTTRTDGRSLLGSIVEMAGLMALARPSVALAHELAAVDRPQDGFPTTFRLALGGDVEGLLPRLNDVLTRLDDETHYDFVRGMIGHGPPMTDVVFEAIGRGPTDVRDRVVAVVRKVTERMKETALELAKLKLDDPVQQALVREAAAKPNPWPEFAARLGVSDTDN